MAEVILMPRLSDTMTEGVIAAWHKKVGDNVKKGDLLAEVETDKATMELESYKDGTLLHIGIEKGGKLQVNDLLAIIGSPGEDISSLLKDQQSPANNQPAETSTKTEQQSTTQQTSFTEIPIAKETSTTIDISKLEEVVLMPRLSDTMTEGVIAEWHKNVGDPVKKGDILAEIETDKATMELESYKNGTLLYTGAKKGEKIQVNELLCIIGEKENINVEAIVAASKGDLSGKLQQAAIKDKEPAIESVSKETSNIKNVSSPISTPVVSEGSSNGRVKASPLAKKIAIDKGIDIKKLAGSGDGGRVIKADVDKFVPQSTEKQTAVSTRIAALSSVAGEEGFTDIPNSQIRNVIAKRLTESKFSAPHFYLTMEINMDNAISFRTQLNEVSPVKVSFNDMVVKAAALALRQHPAVNASWLGDKIRRYHHIHIGVAVAIEDGLIVPVIRFADQKSFPQIASESKELAGKAKNKKLQPNEFSGNTFTISNLGMMDIEEFTAIINPPDSCIMAVGKIKETVVKKADGFGTSNFMKVTLSCDHRSVDGALGAAFLQTFKKYLENPVGMML